MQLKISSTAFGSKNLTPVKPNQQLINKDFTIISNNSRINSATGDGIDEKSEWNFNFTSDSNWSFFSKNDSIYSAIITLIITPKHPDIGTDNIKINYGNLKNIEVREIKQAQVGKTKTIVFDLLKNGYKSSDILKVIRNNNGIIPMLYQDDSIVSFAKLELSQTIGSNIPGKLSVEAISEDTIASPGNRKSNYLIVSVLDSNGQPVTDLSKNNFKVDPIIVGAGGSLINIERVQHASRINGFYFLSLKPIRQETWKSGVYVFAIVVNKNDLRGQTLSAVLMD